MQQHSVICSVTMEWHGSYYIIHIFPKEMQGTNSLLSGAAISLSVNCQMAPEQLHHSYFLKMLNNEYMTCSRHQTFMCGQLHTKRSLRLSLFTRM